MEEIKLKQVLKSVKVKDIILLKDSISKVMAFQIGELLKKPVILIKDFSDFSSIDKKELKKILKQK